MFATGIPSPPQIFQTYLLPNLSFRRRKSSSDTATTLGSFSSGSSSLSTSPTSPGSFSSDYGFSPIQSFPFLQQTQPSSYLSGATSHISCSRCHADLALTSQIISKGFTGRHGRAYLVAGSPSPLTATPSASGSCTIAGLPNTHTHKAMPRHLVTGLHTVSDISCALCGSVLGWKYVSAEEEAQRYKVGKFILETRRVTVGSCWENDEADENELDGDNDGQVYGASGSSDDIAFDSQDEDECEDLFAGIWSPQLAKRRRGRKLSMRAGG